MVLNPDVESYLNWYLPNVVFSQISLDKKKNPLCGLAVKNSVIMRIAMPRITVVNTDDLHTIINNYIPQIPLDLTGSNLGKPRFEFINFVNDQTTITAYIRFYKNDPKPFNFDEFIAYQLENNTNLKNMIALLQTPEVLIKSEINDIYYFKNKNGNVYPCISKIKIDHTEYYNITIDTPDISKHNLKILNWMRPVLTLALV